MKLPAYSSRLLFALGFFVPVLLVGFAVVLTVFYHVAACPLCIVQRGLYLLIALAALPGLAGTGKNMLRLLSALSIAAVASVGAAIAGYQIYMQRHPFSASCGDGTSWWERAVEQAGLAWPVLFRADGLCSDSAWTVLGLSIVEWSLLAFSALTLLGILALLIRPPR